MLHPDTALFLTLLLFIRLRFLLLLLFVFFLLLLLLRHYLSICYVFGSQEYWNIGMIVFPIGLIFSLKM